MSPQASKRATRSKSAVPANKSAVPANKSPAARGKRTQSVRTRPATHKGQSSSGMSQGVGKRASLAQNARKGPVEPATGRALRSQGLETMRRLLDAAMVVFSRLGYHAARVDDIVKVARTSHGTFYLYFSNKEDLLRALVSEAAEVVASLDTTLGQVGPDAKGWREVREWIERFSEAWQRYAPVLRAWTDLLMSDAELAAQARAASRGIEGALAVHIAEAGPPPGIDPVAASEAVVAMVDRFHQLRQFAREPIDSPALDTLTTIVHRALFGGTGPPTARPRRSQRLAGARGR